MDKSREQFEAAIEQKFGDLIDQRVCKNGDGEYMAWDMQVAWWAWQASRAAVEIEIPEGETVFSTATDTYGEDGCVMLPVETMEHVIRAAGLRVKGG
ncbi:hypothetical protein MQ487_000483 [Cronobacter sakazakii]|uniref:hypothetical protein n=1 Tax=Cronobacter sakazakii TaxID=28141 RepID=UPI0009755C46|nr:hypothetical protein [Cronobacter sakazakii]EIZ8816813.1 hypothetical protein [Cronobacter sakazakii]EME1731730.1 hypothetical protein [Cronobacter sakazakii]EME1758791.1 hypothetical protein [Cronobacter sakazakii]